MGRTFGPVDAVFANPHLKNELFGTLIT
jgi:hypothetical protein